MLETSEQFDALLKALEKSRTELNAGFVELRFAKANRFIDNYPSRPEYHGYHLALDREPRELFRTFHKSCIQRAIKKGRRQDLEIVTENTEQDLEAFYRLHLMTRMRHGVLIQPFRFFRNLWNTLSSMDMLTLLSVHSRGKMVAGIILLWFKDVAYYKFGACDVSFMHLRVNQLLMWEAIQLAQERGCQMFDFGRANYTIHSVTKFCAFGVLKQGP